MLKWLVSCKQQQKSLDETVNKAIRIFSDNKASLYARGGSKNVVLHCRNTLELVSRNKTVDLAWIKLHAGNHGGGYVGESRIKASSLRQLVGKYTLKTLSPE